MNDTMWGTLSCSILVHPKTMKDPKMARVVEEAIAAPASAASRSTSGRVSATRPRLDAVGAFPGTSCTTFAAAAAGSTTAYLRPRAEGGREEGRGANPKPAWFVNNKNSHGIGRALTDFNAKPGIANFAKVIANALRVAEHTPVAPG
ncbi:MAG: hypothetical protein R3B99_13645 [Polyangiales bacterium]